MKTRVIKTSFWRDSLVSPMNIDSKLLYLYILTNEHAGLTDYQQIILQEASLYTGLEEKLILHCINQLQDKGLLVYYQGWIKVTGGAFVNSNYKGGNVDSARDEELSRIPESVKYYMEGFEIPEVPDEVPSQVPINHKSKIINNKPKIINSNTEKKNKNLEDITREDLEEISLKYEVPFAFVEDCLDSATNYINSHGKRYKDYKAMLIGWVKRERKDLQKLKYTTNERTRYGKSASYFGK